MHRRRLPANLVSSLCARADELTRSASGRGSGASPDDPRLDPELLATGDRRNVVDAYRYWRMYAIVADLDARRHPFHVAIENFAHDFNIGSVVRTANAFLAAEVHIVGRASVEPPGSDGHRPLPARTSPRGRRRPAALGCNPPGCPCSASTTCPEPYPWRRTTCRAPASCSSARRARGCRTRRGPPAMHVLRSRSTGRRARSTRVPPRRSRCTRGYAGTSSARPRP